MYKIRIWYFKSFVSYDFYLVDTIFSLATTEICKFLQKLFFILVLTFNTVIVESSLGKVYAFEF